MRTSDTGVWEKAWEARRAEAALEKLRKEARDAVCGEGCVGVGMGMLGWQKAKLSGVGFEPTPPGETAT